jgi:hypothetical protein
MINGTEPPCWSVPAPQLLPPRNARIRAPQHTFLLRFATAWAAQAELSPGRRYHDEVRQRLWAFYSWCQRETPRCRPVSKSLFVSVGHAGGPRLATIASNASWSGGRMAWDRLWVPWVRPPASECPMTNPNSAAIQGVPDWVLRSRAGLRLHPGNAQPALLTRTIRIVRFVRCTQG